MVASISKPAWPGAARRMGLKLSEPSGVVGAVEAALSKRNALSSESMLETGMGSIVTTVDRQLRMIYWASKSGIVR